MAQITSEVTLGLLREYNSGRSAMGNGAEEIQHNVTWFAGLNFSLKLSDWDFEVYEISMDKANT